MKYQYQIPIDERKGLCSEAETVKLQSYAVEILDAQRDKLMTTTLSCLIFATKVERKRLTFAERDNINGAYAMYKKYKTKDEDKEIVSEEKTIEQELDTFCKPVKEN